MAGAVNSRVSKTVDEILQGAGKFKVDGLEVGCYSNGVRVTYAQTEAFVDAECALGHVDSEITLITMQVSTEFDQATLENLAIAWGLHSSSVLSGTSSKVLDLIPTQVMREVQLVFEGMSATNRDKVRTFTINKAVRIGSSETTLQRGTKTTLPVTFECLLDSDGSFGQIVDSTITA